MATAAPSRSKPLLRGWLHLVAAIAAPFALVWLLLLARSPSGYVAASIYGTGLILLFSVSAGYHLVPWPDTAKRILSRVDQSVIFVAIAASYTPFCLQTLSLAWGIPILAVAWTTAAIGVALRLTWSGLPRVVSVIAYLGLGWLALVAAYPLSTSLSAPGVATLITAGLLFTAGAVVFTLRWPNPFPRVFGFHEVFHAFVTAGMAVVYALVATTVVSA